MGDGVGGVGVQGRAVVGDGFGEVAEIVVDVGQGGVAGGVGGAEGEGAFGGGEAVGEVFCVVQEMARLWKTSG